MDMKRKLFKSAFMAACALVGIVLTSCGGSGESNGKSLPTDGIFGEIPQLCADYQALQDKYTSGALSLDGDAMKKLTEGYDKFEAAFKPKADALLGVEVKTEFGGDFPYKLTKPFTVGPYDDGGKFYNTGSYGTPADIRFKAEGETTESLDLGYGVDLAAIAYDTDGNIISCNRVTLMPTERKLGKREAGTPFTITYLFVFHPWLLEQICKLDKIVLIDRENELVQQSAKAFEEARKGWQASQDSLRQLKQNK